MSEPSVITGWAWICTTTGMRSGSQRRPYAADLFHILGNGDEEQCGDEPDLLPRVHAVLTALAIPAEWRVIPLWDGEAPDDPTWEAWSTTPDGEFARLAAAAALPRIRRAADRHIEKGCDEYGCSQQWERGLDYVGDRLLELTHQAPTGFLAPATESSST